MSHQHIYTQDTEIKFYSIYGAVKRTKPNTADLFAVLGFVLAI